MVALVAYLTGCKVRWDHGATASMNLDGELVGVGAVDVKAKGMEAAGVTRLVVAMEDKHEYQEGKTLSLLPVASAFDAIAKMCIPHPGA